MLHSSDRLVAEIHPSMTSSSEDSGFSLLLIDAGGGQRAALLQALANAGVTVHLKPTIAAAQVCLTSVPIHGIVGIISPVGPDMFEFCRRLKQVPQLASLPVVLMGVAEDDRDRLRALSVGAAAFLSLASEPSQIVAQIQAQMLPHPARQQAARQAQQMIMNRQYSPLLANLQKTLRQQTVKLKAQNEQLQQEIRERQEIERALRQEQQKSEQLLLNILPGAVVNQLKQFQGSLAERFDETTVLFADIVNFTPLAAQYSPLALVNLLNHIFSEFDRLAEVYQLEKIKTIGDAYMAVGGVPVPREDHAIAIADLALAMQTAIGRISQEREVPLQLRIGINSGTVVAGVIGIKKFSYDLWGDTVNVASRMESQGQPGKIQVTTNTYQKLNSLFCFEPAHKIEIKGKGLMKTYYLLGRR
ncbi:MAG: adenylate/guanylate cyclase domain-containing protein [Leptolyngbyaceae cyanobacterium]